MHISSEEKCTAKCKHAQKETWRKGPWTREPDRLDFRHAGLPCLLHRGPTGVWCGYVAVPPGHPLYQTPYNQVEASLDVHGGVTYAEMCSGAICHVPEPGEPDNVWWFGWDAGHAGDYCPAFDTPEMRKLGILPLNRRLMGGESYRTLKYARRETERLAEQLAHFSEGSRG